MKARPDPYQEWMERKNDVQRKRAKNVLDHQFRDSIGGHTASHRKTGGDSKWVN